MKSLQWLFFISITAMTLVMPPFLWLGLAPEKTFLEFISGWQTIGVVGSIVATYAAIVAFLFGWDPRAVFGSWARRNIVLPVVTGKKSILILCCILIFVIFAQIYFIYSFNKVHYPILKEYLVAEDFDSADKLIEGGRVSGKKFWSTVNDAMRQQFFSTSQGADDDECRKHLVSLENTSLAFQRAWYRYFADFATASCRQVLDDPKKSLAYYKKALDVARFLSKDDAQLIKRKMAAIYLYDKDNQTDITDEKERYNKVITLVTEDMDFSAQRILGSAYYLLGEYAKAAEIWNRMLERSTGLTSIEEKRLLNNISLAYQKGHQYQLAINVAKTGIAKVFDIHNEAERREQIRILSTLSQAYTENNQCDLANSTWDERNKIRLQELSPCTSLLDVQIRSCQNPVNNYETFLSSLLTGVGQRPETFIDRTPLALQSLVEQAELKFRECYLGLTFRKEDVMNAVMSGM